MKVDMVVQAGGLVIVVTRLEPSDCNGGLLTIVTRLEPSDCNGDGGHSAGAERLRWEM